MTLKVRFSKEKKSREYQTDHQANTHHCLTIAKLGAKKYNVLLHLKVKHQLD